MEGVAPGWLGVAVEAWITTAKDSLSEHPRWNMCAWAIRYTCPPRRSLKPTRPQIVKQIREADQDFDIEFRHESIPNTSSASDGECFFGEVAYTPAGLQGFELFWKRVYKGSMPTTLRDWYLTKARRRSSSLTSPRR